MAEPQEGVHVTLTKTFVTPELSASLLSVPAMTKKDIVLLFMPGMAIILDLWNDNAVLGYVRQDTNGLFYISDDRDTIPVDLEGDDGTVTGMVAIAKNAFNVRWLYESCEDPFSDFVSTSVDRERIENIESYSSNCESN